MSKVKYLSNSSRNLPHTVSHIAVAEDKWGARTESAAVSKPAYVEEGTFAVQTVDGQIETANFLIIFDGDYTIDMNDDVTFNSQTYKVMSIEKIRGMRNEITETEVLVGRWQNVSTSYRALR